MNDILKNLQQTQALEWLELPHIGDRTAIKCFKRGDHETSEPFVVGERTYTIEKKDLWLRNVSMKDLHFLDCDLSSCSFHEVEITNCVFDRCNLAETGFWKSKVIDTQFISCNMRRCALGGIDTFALLKRPNHFVSCQFRKCDLRSSAHSCESYKHCIFDGCNLRNVLFLGAILEDCVFRGVLDGVEFRHSSERRVQPNRLLRCDFREAELRDCQFLNIDLDASMFPESDDLLWLPNGPEDVRRWQSLYNVSNRYIQSKIEDLGTPSYLCRSTLEKIGLTQEQIHWFACCSSGCQRFPM